MNALEVKDRFALRRYLPFLAWLPRYKRRDLAGDLMAGVIVAIMLVPQGMAYAMLAGLPPQGGLYVSIVPTIIYGLLGTSRTLAVGPVALTSLMVAAGVGALAEPGSAAYLTLALTVAFLAGIMQLVMGALRLGMLVNFISHPVLSGFTSAAALIIALSQIKHLIGVSAPREAGFFATIQNLWGQFGQTNPATLAIGLGAILLLLFFQWVVPALLARWKVPDSWRTPLARSGPLAAVIMSILVVWGLSLHETAGVAVVGDIPAGLPPLTWPVASLSGWGDLLPTALALALVAFLESISVAKALASKRREKVDANQELIALGAANLGAAVTGGYPVAGGFARSVVNDSVGARTGLASIITALLVALTLIFLMPLFYFLPRAALAAIIVVAVVKLVDTHTLKHVWQYNKADGLSLLATFGAVLALGIENGILAGVAISLALYLWRTSRPHMAVVGRVGTTEHYRNIERHLVHTCRNVLAVRIDESLYFANAQYLETSLLNLVAEQPEVDHLVLIGSAINEIDASALESLENLRLALHSAGVRFYLAEIKGPVMDRLKKVGFVEEIGSENIFLSTHAAMQKLGCEL